MSAPASPAETAPNQLSVADELDLFHHNPPLPHKDDPRFSQRLRQLFCNRERDMARGRQRLLRCLGEGSPDALWLIQGESRIGKSHYARLLVIDVMQHQEAQPYHFFIQANSAISARRVLEAIYTQLVDALLQEPAVEKKPERLVHVLRRLENSSGEETASNGELQDMDLVLAIATALDRLALVRPPRVLLLIDDVDLIRSGSEGSKARDEILDYLRRVFGHTKSRPIFLLTTRKLPKDREKEARLFIDLDALSNADLAAIYRRHTEVYLEGCEVFEPATVNWLVQHAAQRVGVFLHQCRAVYDFAWSQDHRLPLGESVRQAWLQHEWSKLREDEDAGSFAMDVENHVLASKPPAGFSGIAKAAVPLMTLDRAVEDTALIHAWLRIRGVGRYEIAPALVEFLRRDTEGAGG